jgi:hypothetical protein
VDQRLALGDALIRNVHYQAYIFRSDADVTPQCSHAEPAAAEVRRERIPQDQGRDRRRRRLHHRVFARPEDRRDQR